MNELLKKIYGMYVKDKIGTNEICLKCQNESKGKGLKHIGPIPIFHVGDQFESDDRKILFIGSVPYGWDEILDNNSLSDQSQSENLIETVEKRIKELFLEPKGLDKKIKLFGAIRAICKEIFDSVEEAYPRIAITNVIKCNAGNVRGGAPVHMKSFCANECHNLMVTKREIEILNPQNIISLAGTGGNAYVSSHWKINQEAILLLPHPASRKVKYSILAKQVKNFFEQRSIDNQY